MRASAQESLDSVGDLVGIAKLAFPDHQYAPVESMELPTIRGVSSSVAFELVEPELAAGSWHDLSVRTAMPVPEAAVDEDHGVMARQHEIGAAGQRPIMQAVTIAHRVDETPNNHLGLRICSADRPHVAASLCWRQNICHRRHCMITIVEPQSLASMSEEELVTIRASLEVEMRRRGLRFSVGDIGEGLVVDHFNNTPGLPNLQPAPTGTKNVDALSRSGHRYSIKTIWKAKKTGTVYPDSEDRDKQLFEYLLIVLVDDDLELESIYQLSWDQFLEARAWDKRMNAWYVPCSGRALACGTKVL